jgi:hypothetical protein
MRTAFLVISCLIQSPQGGVIDFIMLQLYRPATQLERGVVESGTYKNSVIGLELTPDPELKLGDPEIKGEKREIPFSLTISAWGPVTRNSARTGLALSAIALDYYPPDRRSTDACMEKVIEGNSKNGYETLEGDSRGELGGISFARRNFFKAGPIYQSAFVRACAARVLILVFTGPDRSRVNRMISRTDLKLDLVTSGCARQR